MVQGLSYNSSIFNLGYLLNINAGQRISLPVAQSSLIYSNLRNVYGVPAPEGSNGIAISKLNILDVLIEQMNQFRKSPEFITGDLKDAGLDALIDSLNAQIIKAKEAKTAMPYTPAPSAEAGLLFSFTI